MPRSMLNQLVTLRLWLAGTTALVTRIVKSFLASNLLFCEKRTTPRYSPGLALRGQETVSQMACVSRAGRLNGKSSRSGSGNIDGARRITSSGGVFGGFEPTGT